MANAVKESMSLNGTIINLADVELPPVAEQLRQEEFEVRGPDLDKKYPIYEWQRQSHVLSVLQPGETCLEVGPGRRYLLRMIEQRGLYEKIHAIDIKRHPKMPDSDIEFSIMDVSSLAFEDNAFDTVICMEVLEHLEGEAFDRAIDEIRRVCRRQLIITVPFCEPLPLSRYHHQRIDADRVRRVFPNGRYSLMLKQPVNRVPWLLIEEDL